MPTPTRPVETPSLTRRRFLTGTTVGALAATAGCTSIPGRLARPRAARWLATETTATSGHFRALDPSTLPDGDHTTPAAELNWLLGIDLLDLLAIGVDDTDFAVSTYGLSVLATALDRGTITTRLADADWSRGDASMGAEWLEAPETPWTAAVLGDRVLLAQPDGFDTGDTAREKLVDAIRTYRGVRDPRTAHNRDLARLVRAIDGADDAFGRTGPAPSETDEAMGLFAGQVAMGTAYDYGEPTTRRRVYVFGRRTDVDLERMRRFNAEEARDRGGEPAGVHRRGRLVVLRQTMP